MIPCCNIQTEETLLGNYLAVLPTDRVRRELDRIHRTCQEFRAIYANESILKHTHSSEWIPRWVEATRQRLSPAQRVSTIEALGRWWSWLFDHGFIDDNILGCFYPPSQILRETQPLVLRNNLQRLIALYLGEHSPRGREGERKISRLLTNFNVFVHRVSAGKEFRLDEDVVLQWLRELSSTRNLHSLDLAAGRTNAFLQFLVETGRLSENPLAALRARYVARNRKELLAGLFGIENIPPPVPSVPKPPFVSPLRSHLEAFVALKRAMGRKYERSAEELQRFDRFVANFSGSKTSVNRELVHAWIETGGHLHPRIQKKRFGLIRQFCVYIVRLDPQTYVPERFHSPTRIPKFQPYIYSVEEFRAILKAAIDLPSTRHAMRAKVMYTALLILYATGMRIGEALRLRLRDVDLEADTLLVRDSKFFKSRVVPVSGSLSKAIRDYLQERCKAAASPEAFLFLNTRGHPYSPDDFSKIFRRLQVAAGILRVPGQRGPRVYDVRHTFAVNCLLRWYREGANLQAKLPFLATYMGHVDVFSTQEYLKATPELLQEASKRFESSYGSVINV